MKKIIFFEPEVKNGVGHHLDNLIQDAYFFKNNKKIIGFLNKEFNKKDLFIPKFIKLKPIIATLDNNLLLNVKFFLFLVKKLIFFFYYFKKKNKLLIFLKTFALNYFSIPIYFFSFYEKFKQIDLTEKDHLLIQSCRPKDIELVFFLCSLEEKIPNIHIKLRYPPKKKRLKNFFFYANKIIKLKNTNNKFFIYSEIINIKNIIESEKMLKSDIAIPIYNFYNRKIISNSNKQFTLGFLGESRNEKGFSQLPFLLKEIYKKKNDFKFIIQLSDTIYPETEHARNTIINLAKYNKKIIIHHGFLNFLNWRRFLKKIDIMPIIYQKSYTDSVASGLFYSCISNEIPMIIPKNTLYMKNLLSYKGFHEAETMHEYAEQLYKISNNYKYYLKEMKKESKNYKNLLKYDSLISRIK
jgi:hypothetical protein